MFDDTLHYLANSLEQPDWNRLGANLPYEWIEQAVQYTGAASIRKRRLPAEQVVWLVIGLALYRHQSIGEVLSDLELALPNLDKPDVSKSAIAQARQRLGAEPLEWLFNESAKAWTEHDKAKHLFKGLELFALDGTTLRTQDSPENREHFGSQTYAKGTVASYPQVRGVTLTSLPTHLVRAAGFGPYAESEMTRAKELLGDIPDDSLTVFDKGFLSAELLCRLNSEGTNRHFIIPAKSNTAWEVIPGSKSNAFVRMKVSSQARQQWPDLPEYWEARVVNFTDKLGKARTLLTSLNDRRRFKDADIAACYLRRWEIETSYRELKQTMLGMAITLRSKHEQGVYQEIWGTLIAYNLIRLEIAKAAKVAKCEPTQVSFILAFHLIQYELHWAAATSSYGKLPASMKRLHEKLIMHLKPDRPARSAERVVKRPAQRYPFRTTKKAAI
jgi:hypothetical protein